MFSVRLRWVVLSPRTTLRSRCTTERVHKAGCDEERTISVNTQIVDIRSPRGIDSDSVKCRAVATWHRLTNEAFTSTLDVMLTNHLPSFAKQGSMHVRLDVLREARSR